MAFNVSKVGLLGQSYLGTVATHTVYTVPSGSTAMVGLIWSAAGQTGFNVWVGSAQIYSVSGGDDSLTAIPVNSIQTADPTNLFAPGSGGGILEGSISPTFYPLVPFGDFGLDSEETVRYQVVGTSGSIKFRVQGKEFTT